MSTTGGENLSRHIREAKANAGETLVEVGFKDPQIAPLAVAHEFGIARVNLPERPAFRAGVARLPDVIAGQQAGWTGAPTHEQLVDLALAILDTIKTSYLEFHGAPLSERQRERKEGTPAAGTQLQGVEGPRLIEHLGAWVNDDKVS